MPGRVAPCVLLLSTYDLGRQPFGLASPTAWLRRAGFEVESLDLSRDRLSATVIDRAGLVAVYLPMHTATRLALPVLDRIRGSRPDLALCAYGLSAPLNASLLTAHGVTTGLGPEAEADLVEVARATLGAAPSPGETATTARAGLPRLAFIPPDRRGLPPLARYAPLVQPDGSRRLAGSTDATRGCKHRCRHCPIVPVYDGQFRVVPVDVVLADVAAQVEQGATHITFGDPDFLNGPVHACRVVDALHAAYPSVTYDVTIKVEHLLRHQDLLPRLAATGCLFVTSAVEAVDDVILARLEKGHTRADVERVVAVCRAAGLTFVPTFVAFTPWTTLDGYRDLLETVEGLGLVEHVAPVQWGIRLLVTARSRLLELPDITDRLAPFDPATLTYPWHHVDPRVDALQEAVMQQVGVGQTRPRAEVFAEVAALVGLSVQAPLVARTAVPYLAEPWYCCAEPTAEQVTLV